MHISHVLYIIRNDRSMPMAMPTDITGNTVKATDAPTDTGIAGIGKAEVKITGLIGITNKVVGERALPQRPRVHRRPDPPPPPPRLRSAPYAPNRFALDPIALISPQLASSSPPISLARKRLRSSKPPARASQRTLWRNGPSRQHATQAQLSQPATIPPYST